MELASEHGAAAETKKIVNPRVEIDTSPPFESVKEAVDRFGGSGPWVPHHLLRLAPDDGHEFNVDRIEEQAAQLEKDLMIKEQETLNVLKELEAAKRFVGGLKLNFMPEFASFLASPDLNLESPMNYSNSDQNLISFCPLRSTGSMFLELNRAKLNLNKTSIDLAVIQESVESLNKKMRRDKSLLERRVETQVRDSEQVLFSRNMLENYTNGCIEPKRVDFETEQFKKMTEASRYEVMKAMAEIERTKNSIKMAEMRLNAAKKMEEAAKAVEAIAIFEKSSEKSSDALDQSNGVTLSFEEYRKLTRKAQKVEDMCKNKFIDSSTIQRKKEDENSDVAVMEEFEETKQENKQPEAVDLGDGEDGSKQENRYSKFKFRNSHSGHRSARVRHEINGSSGTTSMGDILGRKVILQDDIIVGKHVEGEHTSLSQMLREQSRLILQPGGDTNVEKSYIVQRKKFGFIQVPVSIKKTKKRTQPLNVR